MPFQAHILQNVPFLYSCQHKQVLSVIVSIEEHRLPKMCISNFDWMKNGILLENPTKTDKRYLSNYIGLVSSFYINLYMKINPTNIFSIHVSRKLKYFIISEESEPHTSSNSHLLDLKN